MQLMPHLARDARIVLTSSITAYHCAKVTADDLESTNELKGYAEGDKFPLFTGADIYAKSKAMNALTAQELARRLCEAGRDDLFVASFHPGVVRSSMGVSALRVALTSLAGRVLASSTRLSLHWA